MAGFRINTPGVNGRYCIQFFEIRISDFTSLRGTRREDAESGVFLGHTPTRFRDPGSGPHPRKGARMPTSRMVLGDPPGPDLAKYAAEEVHRVLFGPTVCLFCPYCRLDCHSQVGHMTHNQQHAQNAKKVPSCAP